MDLSEKRCEDPGAATDPLGLVGRREHEEVAGGIRPEAVIAELHVQARGVVGHVRQGLREPAVEEAGVVVGPGGRRELAPVDPIGQLLARDHVPHPPAAPVGARVIERTGDERAAVRHSDRGERDGSLVAQGVRVEDDAALETSRAGPSVDGVRYRSVVIIRPAGSRDIPAMQAIELEAGSLFADIGMQAVADDEPFTSDELVAFMDSGLAWVAVDERDEAVGYLVGLIVDGRAHIEQVSVRPSHSRRGIGRALVDHFVAWATGQRLPAITLTTFVEVPWNAPYYARLGFRPFDVDERSPDLQSIRAAEAAHGMDRWPRIAMIREVGAATE